MSQSHVALVISGSSVTTLGTCRNLSPNKIDVYCANFEKDETAFSKYCKKFFVVSGIDRKTDVLSSFLRRFEEEIKKPAVIFPASDLACLALAEIADTLTGNYVFLTSRDSIKNLVDKRQFAASLSHYDISYPRTYLLDSENDAKSIVNEAYPILVKPALTQNFATKYKTKCFVANNIEELDSYIHLVMKDKIPVVLQEIVQGPPTNLFGIAGYMDRNNEIKGLFAYRRLRGWPKNYGCNSLIESIPLSQVAQAKDNVAKYLHGIKYCGLFEAEFKIDERNGTQKLLEINARAWWQNHFPTACGLNLVLMAFEDAIGKKVKYNDKYQTGVRWVHSFNDTIEAITEFRNGELSLSNWARSYKNLKDHSFFNPHDELPSAVHPFFVGPEYVKAMLTKLSIIESPVSS
jgi:predicted ATP-grasp superfamily ATP-dependent carboligase